MKNIYLRELKNYRKPTLFWSLGIAAGMAASIAKYQGFSQSGVAVNDLFKGLPSGLASLLGVNSVDLSSASGYFVVVVLYISVMLAIHAVLLGSGIVAKEETDRTAEFLFAKPVSRGRALAAKLWAALTIVVALNVVTLVTSVVGMDTVTKDSSIHSDIFFLMPAILGIQIYFLVVGFAFASIMHRPKRAGQWAGGILLGTYILSSFVDVTDKLNFLEYLTPFKYFDARVVFAERAYDPVYVGIASATVVGLVITSFTLFRKRDLST